MNVWNFTGNLGNDCETRYTPSGEAAVTFNVAVKSGFGDKATTTWARCVIFGKRGDAVAPFLIKGTQVGISGEASLREWQDKEGLKRSTLEVRVNDLTLLGGRSGAQNQGQAQQARQAQSQTPQRQPQTQSAGSRAIMDMEDDIPFTCPRGFMLHVI